MTMRTIRFEENVYIAAPRPGSTQLLANDGYRRLQIIDAAKAEIIGHVDFAEGAEGFCLHEWYVAPNGAWSVAMMHDEDYALRFDHVEKTSRRLGVIETMGQPSPTCWFEPGFQFTTLDGLTWALDDTDRFMLQPPSESFVHWVKRASESFAAFRSYAHYKQDNAAGLIYLVSPDSDRIGSVNTTTGEVNLIDTEAVFIDFAFHAGQWFIGCDHHVEQHGPNGKGKVFELADNERLKAVHSISFGGQERLCVLSGVVGGDDFLHIFDELP